MKIRNTIFAAIMALSPCSTRAQAITTQAVRESGKNCMTLVQPINNSYTSILHKRTPQRLRIIPELGVFGNKTPELIYGTNINLKNKRNTFNVFIGGYQNKNKAGFAGKITEKYTWSPRYKIASYLRGIFMAQPKSVTSSIDIAPITYNNSIGKCNFSIMSAYSPSYNFSGNKLTHRIKEILQTQIPLGKNDRYTLCLEAQYASIPTENFLDTHFGKFTDCFNYITTLQMRIGK